MVVFQSTLVQSHGQTRPRVFQRQLRPKSEVIVASAP